jgi:glycosyltransferase involved in cell wall biosynthesis
MTDKIKNIAGLQHIEQADAIYRIHYPYNLSPVMDKPVTCFMTCESSRILPQHVFGIDHLGNLGSASGITIVTPSNWSKDGLVRCGIHPDLITVIPHGVDATIFSPATPESKNAIKKALHWEDRFVFLNIGSMSSNKGIDILLKAFAIVNSKYPETLLCLKGSNSLYSSSEVLREASHLLNAEEIERVTNNTHYLGSDMPFSSIANLYQAADVYVAPYRAEGFNIPVLEAAACGTPIICTSGGPTDDFTIDSFTMRIESTLVSLDEDTFLEPSLDHLVHLMNKIIEDADFRENAAIYGPLNTFLNFSWEIIVESLIGAITATTPADGI